MNILVVGCGYIGLDAAALFKKKGHQVTATTRHPERLEALSHVAQRSVVLKGNDEQEYFPLIKENEAIIITIGADSLDQYENAYLNTAKTFRHLALEMNFPRQLIYTSSTGVYGDHHGQWVDETSELKATGERALILQETEKLYLSLQEIGWQVCILRLSEIYGPGRDLSTRVEHLKGHVMPGSGENYTNMIHKTDCANAIEYALRHGLEGVYNLSDDEHIPRKELYDAILHKFHMPKVKWDPSHTSVHSANKRVSNHKIKSEGFVFLHPHRVLD